MGKNPVGRSLLHWDASALDGTVACLVALRSAHNLTSDYRTGLILSGAAFQTSDPTRDLDSLGHLRRVAQRWGFEIDEAPLGEAHLSTSFELGCAAVAWEGEAVPGVRYWRVQLVSGADHSPSWTEIATWLEASAEGLSNWSQRLGNHVAFREMSPAVAHRIQASSRREHLRLAEARRVAADWLGTQSSFVGGRAAPILHTAADRLRRASDLLNASSRLAPPSEGWHQGAREGQAKALGQVRFLERQAAGSIRTLIELVSSN